jgi:Domain of unknown function (DUF4062)
MPDKPLVFISSTSDLAEERKALLANLGPFYQPYLYEEDRARRGSPEEHCREMIESCHVFVGILGASWGSALPSDPQRSIVEWEIDTARARDDLEILTFLKKLPPEAEIDPRQKKLLEEATGFEHGLWCKFFDSTESLVQLVRSSLEGWLVEFWGRMQRGRLDSALRLHRILLGVAVAAVLGLLALAFTPLRAHLTATALVGASACVATLLIGCLVLLLAETGGSHDLHG